MAAAAEFHRHHRGVEARNGPDRQLGGAVGGFPQGRRHFHSRYRAGEGGNVVHIVLGNADLLLHGLGDGAYRHLSLPKQAHVIHNPGLHFQPGQGIGLKQLLVQFVDPGAGLGALGRHSKGMGGGVGIAEAAGIRGQPHIYGFRDGPVRRHIHQGQYIPDDLRAGSAASVHQLPLGKGCGRAMMVNPQGNTLLPGGECLGHHAGGGGIHADQRIPSLRRVLGQARVEPGEAVGNLRIFQHMGSLSQLPQPQAQGGGGAGGVSVRAAVGQNGIVIPFQQETGSLSPRQCHHRGSPQGS